MSETARVLDLFCGAGGFSSGFERAGHEVVAGVDHDEDAVDTFDANHDGEAIQADLTAYSPDEFAEEYGIAPGDVEIVIGGPPCQSFSLANRQDTTDDERNNLVFVFEEYAAFYAPDVALMENVKNIQSGENKALFERLLEDFRQDFGRVSYRVLDASNFGVPQRRERVFVQARNDDRPIRWPTATDGGGR